MCTKKSLLLQGQIVKANNINIWYETFGQKEHPALLLIMGGCCQGVLWHRAFCERLAIEGFYVIRYDHRDAGFSACFDFEKNPYTLLDMVQDAIGLLDALAIPKAHLFGVSLGGFIAELMAGYFPDRVHTIVLLGSTYEIRPMNRAYAGLPAEPHSLLPPPTPEYLAWMREFMKLAPHTAEEQLAQRMEGWNRLSGNRFPLDVGINRDIQQQFLDRLQYPQGILNHITMLRSSESESILRTIPSKIHLPTVVLQGSEDPIFRPEHGQALSAKIEDATYILVEGMGHIPSDHFYDFYSTILKRQLNFS